MKMVLFLHVYVTNLLSFLIRFSSLLVLPARLLLSSLHRFIMPILLARQDRRYVRIVLELADGGDLFDLLATQAPTHTRHDGVHIGSHRFVLTPYTTGQSRFFDPYTRGTLFRLPHTHTSNRAS